MKRVIFLLCFVLVFFLAMGRALAGTEPPVSLVLGDVTQVLLSGLGVLLTSLAGLAVWWIKKRFDVEVPHQWMMMLQQYVAQGVNYAEEQARKALRENKTLNGNEKMNLALEFILPMIDRAQLVSVGKEELRKLIEAQLAGSRRTLPVPITMEPLFSNAGANSNVCLTCGASSDKQLSFLTDDEEETVQKKRRLPTNEGGYTKVALLVLLAPFALALGAACGWLSTNSPIIADNAVDCTTEGAKAHIAEYRPAVEQLIIRSLGGDGRVDWDSVKDATAGFGRDTGACVLAAVVRELLMRTTASVGAASVSLDKRALSAGFENLRNTRYDGKSFRLVDGSL